jgi:hypothetical protein
MLQADWGALKMRVSNARWARFQTAILAQN